MAKILVVEDDQFTQNFIREVLEEINYQVLTTFSGDQAIANLKKNSDIKLILLDIMLPGRSGWDIFMELRRAYPNLKVVFISAIEVSDERRSSLINKDGLADYIVKPFTQEKLLKVVKKVLSKELLSS